MPNTDPYPPCASCGHERGVHSATYAHLNTDTEGPTFCECHEWTPPKGSPMEQLDATPLTPVSPRAFDTDSDLERPNFAICELCSTDPFTVYWDTAIAPEHFARMRNHLHTHMPVNLKVTVRDESVSFTIGDE